MDNMDAMDESLYMMLLWLQAYVGHTEDVPPEIADGGYMLMADILPDAEKGYQAEKFLTYCFPGTLILCLL